jgi:transposase
VRSVGTDGAVSSEVRTFGTMTGDLLELSDWLEQKGADRVAMESTGVYWKPIFNLLESGFEVILVNAHRIKQVPGRKTDVKDAEWIAQLLQYGLLSPSFIPPLEIRELRELTRERAVLIRDRARLVTRLQKVLEQANIKLSSVATDVMGVSGRAMIRAIVYGVDDAKQLAEMARRRLRGKIPELQRALYGRITENHRFMLGQLMERIEFLEDQISQFSARIGEAMEPFTEAAQHLRTIPGVAQQAAEVIVAEVGTDMTKFPTAGHLCSWAGLCPGNNESAGKRRTGKTTKGSQWLRTMLVQCAWAASHAKNQTVFTACFHR